jgi:L-alanine-DL-glutamate epimerase-like enolase superfamily enzyme
VPRGEPATAPRRAAGAAIERVSVSAYTIPTDFPESDGTFTWDRTTLVLAEAAAAGETGIGFTYAATASARLIRDQLAEAVRGHDALDVPGAWEAMIRAVRNVGRPGVASTAVAAVDAALWDLKGRLLDLPLVSLLGAVGEEIPVYGSGGFTSYSIAQLCDQLGGWVADGIRAVKMKIGRDPGADPGRVRAARDAIGPEAELFVDANGALNRKAALALAERLAPLGVTWLEEPVSSDDLEGLRLLRDRAPAGMDIAAGEYGYDLFYFRRMLAAGAVDVLQADATRCAGISEFLRAGALCAAWGVPLSAHTAPSIHAHPCCALSSAVHVEYFHDHARIERMLFDGALAPRAGKLRPDRSRPGLGLVFKRADAERWAVPF